MSENSERRLFGTDGIRGKAGEAPLDPRTVFAIGLAIGHSVAKAHTNPIVLIGRDTRESSPKIARTIAAALHEAGVSVKSAGVVPTPAIAFLTRTRKFQAGIVISASHNPWQDNGIKLFGSDGFKLPDAVEIAIESEILHHASHASEPAIEFLPDLTDDLSLQAEYIDFLLSTHSTLNLNGLRGVVDCANGAATSIVPRLFERLGGQINLENIRPNGRNINDGCGALHPQSVARSADNAHANLGITFDGDADRCLLAGSKNNVINGDAILLMAARDLKQRGLLTGDLVVATTMSNMGLEASLKRSGIRMLRAPVGDRYVLEEMQKNDAALGGEQSGHILFPHLATTGDGILTALVVLDLIVRTGKTIEELTEDLKVFPQVIVNVHVREKRPLEKIPAVVERMRSAAEDLRDSGRVVVRYSGTEMLARVMIEAESEEMMRRHAGAIAAAIRKELGA